MRILGIDPGLNICGYAVIETDDVKLIAAGTCRTNSTAQLSERLRSIAEDMDSLLSEYQPHCVAVEQLYSHYAHPRTAILMGHARGVILAAAARAGMQVKSFSATKIKKSLTGNGRATKQQMQRSIRTTLSLSQTPHPADVADAIAAALCCANSYIPEVEKV